MTLRRALWAHRGYTGRQRVHGAGPTLSTKGVEQHLKLKVNREKSMVDRAIRRPLLGFGCFVRGGQVTVRIGPKARKRAKTASGN